MAKFRFRLETVQKLRERREQEALKGLAHAQRRLADEKNEKIKLEEEQKDAARRREEIQKEEIDLTFVQLENNLIEGNKIRIEQANHRIQVAERSVQKAMRIYLGALKQKRTIEKLREKAFDLFKKDTAKKEQKELDDLITMRSSYIKSQAEEEVVE